MPMFEKGAAVSHGAYGRGTVMAVRHNGYEVRVSFGRYSLWIPIRELEDAPGGLRLVESARPTSPRREEPSLRQPSLDQLIRMLTMGPEEGAPPTTRSAKKDQGTKAEPRHSPCVSGRSLEHATALESFRLGIVPERHVAEWTIGRETELDHIGRFLRDDSEGAVVIEGPYGAGKTHLLTHLAREAEGLGFATALAGFDPSEVAAAFPKKTYRRLVRGFSATLVGGRVGFRGFIKAVAGADGWKDLLGEHWVLGPFLRRVAANSADERDWAWIEGNGLGRSSLPTLHDFTTCANLYCNLLSGLGKAAELLGLNGLAILLDEAEVAGNVFYWYQYGRGLNFYRGLVMTANDEHELLEEEVVREDGVSAGSLSRLIYSGHNAVPYSVGIPSFLKVAFALTPGSLQREFRGYRQSMQTIRVEPLSPDQLWTLFGRICDRFQSVFGVHLGPRSRERMFRILSGSDIAFSTRVFIKAAVEMLDSIRFYPGERVEQVLMGSEKVSRA